MESLVVKAEKAKPKEEKKESAELATVAS